MKLTVYTNSESEVGMVEIEKVYDWSVGDAGELYIKKQRRDRHGYLNTYYAEAFADGAWTRVSSQE